MRFSTGQSSDTSPEIVFGSGESTADGTPPSARA
jgi:hypothetical protein